MIELEKISFSYPNTVVFDNFDIALEENKVNCILGPSGCGKSTLLNILSGDIVPQSGKTENASSEISYVFQSPRLVPQITVFQNLDLVLRSVEKDKRKRKEKILGALSLVGLEAEADFYPAQLSGGMAQRVALARAFVFPSQTLLMDEPFKGLDIALKKSIISAFLSLYDKAEKTVVFVTHDPDEALLLGDRIFMLSNKPATVIKEFAINKERGSRKLYDKDLTEIKNEIYKLSDI